MLYKFSQGKVIHRQGNTLMMVIPLCFLNYLLGSATSPHISSFALVHRGETAPTLVLPPPYVHSTYPREDLLTLLAGQDSFGRVH